MYRSSPFRGTLKMCHFTRTVSSLLAKTTARLKFISSRLVLILKKESRSTVLHFIQDKHSSFQLGHLVGQNRIGPFKTHTWVPLKESELVPEELVICQHPTHRPIFLQSEFMRRNICRCDLSMLQAVPMQTNSKCQWRSLNGFKWQNRAPQTVLKKKIQQACA